MSGIFGGDDSPPPAPAYVPPPPREEIMDVIDRVAGVQSIVVNGPNGKKQRIVERLPRTQEEESLYKKAEEIVRTSIQNIQELYRYNPQQLANFQPFIDVFANLNEERQRDLAQIADFGNISDQVLDFKRMNQALLDEEIARRDRSIEESLAHKGLSDSTAATEYRTSMARNADLARMQNNVNSDIYGQQLAAQRLETNARAFGLREQGRQGRGQAAELGYNLERQRIEDLENKRKQAIIENQNLLGIGAGVKGEDVNKAIMSRAPDIANQTFSMMNADSLNRYNSSVSAQNAAYQNQLMEYKMQPSSFGDKLLQLGGTLGGSMLTAPSGSLAGKIGSRLFF